MADSRTVDTRARTVGQREAYFTPGVVQPYVVYVWDFAPMFPRQWSCTAFGAAVCPMRASDGALPLALHAGCMWAADGRGVELEGTHTRC